MPNFTPGPWHAEQRPTEQPDGEVTDLMVRDALGEPVAWIGMASRVADIVKYRHIEGNAALTAEAPRMASLLYVVHEAVRRGEWDNDLWDWLASLLSGLAAETLQQIGALSEEQTIWMANAPIDEIADQILAEADAICERPSRGDSTETGGDGQQP